MIRLGAELGPRPAEDLLPTSATVLATVAVESPDDHFPPDPDVAAAVVALHRVLGRTPRPWCGSALDAALVGLDPTWSPVQAVRLAAAVAAGLAAGHLPAGRPWALHIVDPVGAAGPALAPVFDLLGGLLDGWDPTLAPPSVTTNVGSLLRSGAGYRAGPGRLATVPDLWIELDLGPPAATGRRLRGVPAGLRDAPTVAVRPAPVLAPDPGPPTSTGPPPNPGPALAAVARWCLFPTGGERQDELEQVAALLEGRMFPSTDVWAREAADLLLATDPGDPAAWCRRALVEAGHVAGSRARHVRLVAAAAATGRAGADLRGHVSALRALGRAAWALDVWATADADLQADLGTDVLSTPAGRDPGELALALAARVEAAASGLRALIPRQTAG